MRDAISAPGLAGWFGAVFLGVQAIRTFRRLPDIRKWFRR